MKKLLVLLAILLPTITFAALTTDQVYNLDHKFGKLANEIQLGTYLKGMESATLGTLADGKVWIGSALGVATAQTVSGDITMTRAGVVTIGSSKILKGMLSTGILPSHVVKFAGTSASEVDADATVVITVTGALSTDTASVVLRAAANSVYVTKAVLTADTLTVTLSGNGGAGTQVDYQVFRAVP